MVALRHRCAFTRSHLQDAASAPFRWCLAQGHKRLRPLPQLVMAFVCLCVCVLVWLWSGVTSPLLSHQDAVEANSGFGGSGLRPRRGSVSERQVASAAGTLTAAAHEELQKSGTRPSGRPCRVCLPVCVFLPRPRHSRGLPRLRRQKTKFSARNMPGADFKDAAGVITPVFSL